ncbi:MAG TPA: hypothetical protein VIJ94_02710 [Caulobacteraceae bacterium]
MGRALLILALAAALAACGRDQRSGAIPAADSPANPTEPADAPTSSLAAHVSAAAPAAGAAAD